MVISSLKAILSHFGPKWFFAILDEAEKLPATIAGLLFMWITIISLSLFAWLEFTNHATAAEHTFASIQESLSANTRALNCNRQDRVITAKVREITTLERLADRTDSDSELREIDQDIDRLNRELNTLEERYKRDCFE